MASLAIATLESVLEIVPDYQSIYKKGTLHGFFPLVEPGS